MKEGDYVKLKPNAPLRTLHPELAEAIGVVGSLFSGSGDVLLHVRFAPPVNLVVLNALSREFETVDQVKPTLREVWPPLSASLPFPAPSY